MEMALLSLIGVLGSHSPASTDLVVFAFPSSRHFPFVSTFIL